MNLSWKQSTTLAYFTLVLLLGGASAGGFLANTFLQLGGALVIGLCLPSYQRLPSPVLRYAGLAFLLFVALQFIPLPPAIWTSLPGRAPVASGFELLGLSAPWMTLSLSPWSSFLSMIWLIPALAMFVAMRSDHAPTPVQLTGAVLVVASVSIGLSAMQVLSDQLYIYDITSEGMGVGFFANANHQGNFLLVGLVLAAAMVKNNSAWDRSSDTQLALRLVGAGTGFLLVLGIVLSNSVACLGLLMLTALAIVFMFRPQLRLKGSTAALAITAVTILLVLFILYGPANDLTRAAEGSNLNRRAIFTTGAEVAWSLLPVGSGVGTFAAIYRTFEDPQMVTNFFVNHAHNDYLELLIEGGVLALLPIALFLAWFARRSSILWRTAREQTFALAGAIIVGIELLHSLVDYPLRTAALSSIMAVAICLMLDERFEAIRTRRAPKSAQRVTGESDKLIRV